MSLIEYTFLICFLLSFILGIIIQCALIKNKVYKSDMISRLSDYLVLFYNPTNMSRSFYVKLNIFRILIVVDIILWMMI